MVLPSAAFNRVNKVSVGVSTSTRIKIFQLLCRRRLISLSSYLHISCVSLDWLREKRRKRETVRGVYILGCACVGVCESIRLTLLYFWRYRKPGFISQMGNWTMTLFNSMIKVHRNGKINLMKKRTVPLKSYQQSTLMHLAANLFLTATVLVPVLG